MSENATSDPSPPWLLGFEGPDPPEEFLRILEIHPPAGLIFFRDNLPHGGPSIERLRLKLEHAAGRRLPVFLDEEGGWIQVSGGRPAWPSPAALATAGLDQLERIHKSMARRAASFGATVLLAPLADLDDGAANPVIGTRSFGANPEDSSRAVQASLAGLRDGGVLAVVKHFPGHGDAGADSHLTLPQVPEDRAEALLPFWRAIRLKVPGVMTAHLRLGENPEAVTYREDIVRDLLQREMGYKGLVMTDALEMAGAAGRPVEERGAAALRAGHHLLVLARWKPGLEAMLEGARAAAEELKPQIQIAWRRWDRFLGGIGRAAPEHLDLDELEERLNEIRRSAIFRPDRREAEPLGVRRIALEFGTLGTWSREEYMRELARFPLRLLDPGERMKTGEAYLHVGRSGPSASRLDELRERALLGTTPTVLIAGAWSWCRRFPSQMSTRDTSPPGVREMVDYARG